MAGGYRRTDEAGIQGTNAVRRRSPRIRELVQTAGGAAVSSLRVGIVLKGDVRWMGGLEYIKNLMLSAETVAPERGLRLDLSVITRGEVPESIRRQVRSPLNVVPIGDGPPPRRFGRIRRLLESGPRETPLDHAIRGA